MMIRSVCSTCFQRYNLLIQASDVELVKEISTNEGRSCPCPRLCGGEINLTGEPNLEGVQLKDPIELTGLELFKAVGGMGLPDEVPKSPVVVTALLKTHKIVSVYLEEINGGLYLHELHLDDGVVIHLASGARGAKVLKITKGKS